MTTIAAPRSVHALLPVVGAELEVPLTGGGIARYANFDYAATAPALESVARAVNEALLTYASVHRGAGLPSRRSTVRYEAARETVAAFAGALPGTDVCVFTRNTTDALNLLSACVPEGGEVVFLDAEHHANLLPWREGPHRCLAAAGTVAETLERLAAALDERPAALVSITGASNVTGECLPIADVVAIAHARGARVAVDAAQLAPHGTISLADWGADYVAFSGHKLYAPFGAGALVGRRDWLDAAPPYLPGGGAVRDVHADGTWWHDAPERHEGGTPNLLGAVALAAATDALAALPAGALEDHEAALRTRLLDGLAQLDGVHVHTLFADAPATIGLVTFTVDGHVPAELAERLSDDHGIGLRAGRFCAHLLLERLGLPGGALRASFGAGSTSDDVDRLLAALAATV